MDIAAIYRDRFCGRTGVTKRDRVWQTLCRSFFNKLIGPEKTILDLACGYGEFINNVAARNKIAVDLNPDARQYLNDDVTFLLANATNIPIPDGSVDVVFASNFLEHLPDKETCNRVFEEVKRVLVPGGRFIIIGPNIRYAYREYWDYFDHFIPLSDRSLCEGLRQAGFRIINSIPRFLPLTMDDSAPTADWLIRLYLAAPLAWRVMGKQFLVVCVRE